MADLIETLRRNGNHGAPRMNNGCYADLCDEAADEIERLRRASPSTEGRNMLRPSTVVYALLFLFLGALVVAHVAVVIEGVRSSGWWVLWFTAGAWAIVFAGFYLAAAAVNDKWLWWR